MGHLRHLGHLRPHEMRNEHEQASSERERQAKELTTMFPSFSIISFSFLIWLTRRERGQGSMRSPVQARGKARVPARPLWQTRRSHRVVCPGVIRTRCAQLG